MSKVFHQRVVVFSYFSEDLPTFESPADQQAYYAAIGRQVCFGLKREATEDTVQLVTMHLSTRPLEVVAAFHQDVAAYPKDSHGYTWHTEGPAVDLDTYVNKYKSSAGSCNRPFVVGAVLHNDGKWGFHS